MGIRYIGSKARLLEDLAPYIGPPTGGFFVDAFVGMGAVARLAAGAGWPVRVNDTLESAVTLTVAQLFTAQHVPFADLGGYHRAVARLNTLPGSPGFFYREYSPASTRTAGVERRYFTEANAARIDAIRGAVAAWTASGVISSWERRLLLADLMIAANQVANTAGTYGCFLRTWSPQALRPVELVPRSLSTREVPFEFYIGDAADVPTKAGDTVYLDPPYTKRQYAAYYHVLETIAAADEPEVGGVTGLRPWRELASPYCYKSRALDALTTLIRECRANQVLLSYSEDGHVRLPELRRRLIELDVRFEVHLLSSIGRYRPNAASRARASEVQEFLVEVWRHP